MATPHSISNLRLGSSFRDPSGFLYLHDGVLYRQVNQIYKENYNQLVGSGLYAKLVEAGLLLPHKEVSFEAELPAGAYRVIRPEPLRFISYPYEWSFNQLKDAALATLDIQKHALESGMVLKDASAYNIQFHQGKPALIDTLSFEAYHEGEPWVAYRQYCQHFLAPLALMAHNDVCLSQLLKIYIDGIPLNLAARLLPWRTRFGFGLATHIHLHAAAQKRYAGSARKNNPPARRISKLSFLGLIDSLESTTRNLRWKAHSTEWGDYYAASSGHYSPGAFDHKKQLVSQILERLDPKRVWDLGANTGEFSRLAASRGAQTISFDLDYAAVDQNYLHMKEAHETNLLPLVMDFTNPSPSIGWHNRERQSLLERAPVDVLMVLALIHHLAISNNVPLPLLASFLHDLGHWLVIEWVPKEDSQVQKLLSSREDIFPNYHQHGFEAAFGEYFSIHEQIPIQDSLRIMYLLEGK